MSSPCTADTGIREQLLGGSGEEWFHFPLKMEWNLLEVFFSQLGMFELFEAR